MLLNQRFILLFGMILLVISGVGCGGGGNMTVLADSPVDLSELHVACNDTLVVTLKDGGTFNPNAAIRFTNETGNYNGNASPNPSDTALGCGFASNVPAGVYDVGYDATGSGTFVKAGQVQFAGCGA
jgi:hypothetical protein